MHTYDITHQLWADIREQMVLFSQVVEHGPWAISYGTHRNLGYLVALDDANADTVTLTTENPIAAIGATTMSHAGARLIYHDMADDVKDDRIETLSPAHREALAANRATIAGLSS